VLYLLILKEVITIKMVWLFFIEWVYFVAMSDVIKRDLR